MFLLRLIWAVVHALFAKRADLVAENLGSIACVPSIPRTQEPSGHGRSDRIWFLVCTSTDHTRLF